MTNVRCVGRFTLWLLCVAGLSAWAPAKASENRRPLLVCTDVTVDPAIWTPDNRVVDKSYLENFQRTLSLLLVKNLYDIKIRENLRPERLSWNVEFVVSKGSERNDPRCFGHVDGQRVISVHVYYELDADGVNIQNKLFVKKGNQTSFERLSHTATNYADLNKSYSRSRYELIQDIRTTSTIVWYNMVDNVEL